MSILKKDVSHRFLNLNGAKIKLYKYKKGDYEIHLHDAKIISEYAEVLSDAINFRWTQILENFNSAPRIAKKVRILDLPEIERKSLVKFRQYLNIENPYHKCFFCERKIKEETPTIDHLIPWSFIFSNDLWNLVYAHQSCNSSKSKRVPNEFEISRLEERNDRMILLLKESKEKIGKNPIEELEIAIKNNSIRKFWVNCKN